MKTIRTSVFETNSSTTHCITIADRYKHIEDVPMRSKSEFPKLNESGELEIELNLFWDMDVRENDDVDFESVSLIMQYLTAHAVFSSQDTKWSRKNHEVVCTFEPNMKNLLKDIQDAYTTVGLEAPVAVRPYFLDVNDKKIYITKDNLYHWFDPPESYWDGESAWLKAKNKKIKSNPDAANWPQCKHYIGMCGNDLLSHSYENATNYYEDYSNVRDWEDNSDTGRDKEITTHEILTRKVSLSFYHT